VEIFDKRVGGRNNAGPPAGVAGRTNRRWRSFSDASSSMTSMEISSNEPAVEIELNVVPTVIAKHSERVSSQIL